MFGWFNAWQPDGAGKYPRLSLLPDSMDVVSIWGNWHSLSEEKIKELRSVQAKGTKVIIGWIIEDIGDQIKWGRDQWPADDTQAIKEYAQAIVSINMVTTDSTMTMNPRTHRRSSRATIAVI